MIDDMSQEQEHASLLLSLRVYFYHLLYLVFGKEPTAETVDLLQDPHLVEAARFLSELVSDETVAHAASLVQDRAKTQSLASLTEAYTHVLLGPHKLAALPWESVYVEKSRLLFQRSTLEVREFYRRFGYETMADYQVADDHVALELNFMAHLALELQENPAATELLEGQREFLEAHLLNWIPGYVHDLALADKPGLYQDAGQLLLAYVRADRLVLDLLKETLA